MTYNQKDADHYKSKKNNHRDAIRIVGIYAVFGALWIYFSDTLLGKKFNNPDLIIYFAIIKGFGYILVTATLLYI